MAGQNKKFCKFIYEYRKICDKITCLFLLLGKKWLLHITDKITFKNSNKKQENKIELRGLKFQTKARFYD